MMAQDLDVESKLAMLFGMGQKIKRISLMPLMTIEDLLSFSVSIFSLAIYFSLG